MQQNSSRTWRLQRLRASAPDVLAHRRPPATAKGGALLSVTAAGYTIWMLMTLAARPRLMDRVIGQCAWHYGQPGRGAHAHSVAGGRTAASVECFAPSGPKEKPAKSLETLEGLLHGVQTAIRSAS